MADQDRSDETRDWSGDAPEGVDDNQGHPLQVPLFDDGDDTPATPAYGAAPAVHPQFAVTRPDPFGGQRGPNRPAAEPSSDNGETTQISGLPSPYPPPPRASQPPAPASTPDPVGPAVGQVGEQVPHGPQGPHRVPIVPGQDYARPPAPTFGGEDTLPPREAPREAPRESPPTASRETTPEPPRPAVLPRPPHDAGEERRGVIVAADSVNASASGRRRSSMGEGIDWNLVRAFRQEAANQLTNATLDREGMDDNTRQELGRRIILDLLSNHAREADVAGRGGFTAREQQQLAEAIFDSLFGLGRLQPLVDNPDLENIEIRGYDNVHLVYSDGRIEMGPAVADSDEELIDTLAFLAARSGGSERPFSPSNPDLDLRLPGGARLAASAWNTPRPLVVIRRHRLVDVDLDDLVALDMLDDGLASFLRAAIRSKKSIVVSGAQGAGKTTLVRALCNEIPPMEAIGTIETEYELHLHEMGGRHPRCSPWESRPGSGEKSADGRRLGEVTLDDILYRSLRMNLSRVIVGEVRGKEVIPMFKAMQAGSGSVSTTHAHSAHAAIERLVTCATEAGPQISEAWAYRQIAEHIDIIVQITMHDAANVHGQGKRERFVAEVVYIEPGEDGRPAITDVYASSPDGRARPNTMPQGLKDLTRWGFDMNSFVHRVA